MLRKGGQKERRGTSLGKDLTNDNIDYTAAGDASGKARIYQKNDLMGTGYIYFVRIKTPYRCKQLEVF